MRQLPAPLVGIDLQRGLTSHRAEQVKTLKTGEAWVELRAVTGPDYSRIYGHELVTALQRIAGNGTGDIRWKCRARSTRRPADASDSDVFLFLVDGFNPIEEGRLPNGSPNL